MGQRITLTADDGHSLGAYRADASGATRGGIVVLQEIFGVNSHIRAVCDGFAADGFTCIAPALYDRSSQRDCELGYEASDMTTGRKLREEFSWDDTVRDVAAAVAVLAGEGLTVGSVGYCWGAPSRSWQASGSPWGPPSSTTADRSSRTRTRRPAARCSCTSASTTPAFRSPMSNRSGPRNRKPPSTSTTPATASAATTGRATTKRRRSSPGSAPSTSSTRTSDEARPTRDERPPRHARSAPQAEPAAVAGTSAR